MSQNLSTFATIMDRCVFMTLIPYQRYAENRGSDWIVSTMREMEYCEKTGKHPSLQEFRLCGVPL